jgi:hypothetical protein
LNLLIIENINIVVVALRFIVPVVPTEPKVLAEFLNERKVRVLCDDRHGVFGVSCVNIIICPFVFNPSSRVYDSWELHL